MVMCKTGGCGVCSISLLSADADSALQHVHRFYCSLQQLQEISLLPYLYAEYYNVRQWSVYNMLRHIHNLVQYLC